MIYGEINIHYTISLNISLQWNILLGIFRFKHEYIVYGEKNREFKTASFSNNNNISAKNVT